MLTNCGIGMGAMTEWSDIVNIVANKFQLKKHE